MWRVQITPPNGCVRYFGRFSSATRARDWIAAHASLINPVSEWGDDERVATGSTRFADEQ
jgi:hypothetical protein